MHTGGNCFYGGGRLAVRPGGNLQLSGNAFRRFKRAFVPEGHYDNIPAFQRWDRPVLCCTRPEGTAESVECGTRASQAGSRPSLRDNDGRPGQGNFRKALS